MQTGYTGLTTLYRNLSYDGGFCEWYYIPKEDIAVWPSLNTAQELSAEPTLGAGKSWYGPVKVPNNTVGFTETIDRQKPGHYYKQKVDGSQPGDSRSNRVILENMPYHQYIVAGKVRAGGYWVILGNPESGLVFDINSDTGRGAAASPKNTISFTGESLVKALILPSFGGQPSTPAPDDPGSTPGGGTTDGPNKSETIPFTGVSEVTINWNDTRKDLFGNFPLIQVWFKDGSIYSLAQVPITCYADPPDTTFFTVYLTGVSEGFIQIK